MGGGGEDFTTRVQLAISQLKNSPKEAEGKKSVVGHAERKERQASSEA